MRSKEAFTLLTAAEIEQGKAKNGLLWIENPNWGICIVFSGFTEVARGTLGKPLG